jgi:hypothetical protein
LEPFTTLRRMSCDWSHNAITMLSLCMASAAVLAYETHEPLLLGQNAYQGLGRTLVLQDLMPACLPAGRECRQPGRHPRHCSWHCKSSIYGSLGSQLTVQATCPAEQDVPCQVHDLHP